ncbi:MAG TPA: hypothetical protein PLS81_07455 [Deltaproteobacteria bacterium]|nr:hypothetical protein [Deltaproteobacteria bacterium]HOM29278.1 hypothetical protein [Deltaproteobacteria bacterium]HPP80860.1 hypothetical protein [Deltaproteobacteria bacterium]
MRFLVDLIASIILAPFKLARFVIVDVLVKGVLAGVVSLVRSILKLLLHPITLLLVASGAAAYFYSSEEQKKKVKALIGL